MTIIFVSLTFDDILRPGWAVGRLTVDDRLSRAICRSGGIIDRRGSVLRSSCLSLARRRTIDKWKLAHELRAIFKVLGISCCLFYERCAPMQCRGGGYLRDHRAGRLNYASSTCPGLNRADPTPAVLPVVQEL